MIMFDYDTLMRIGPGLTLVVGFFVASAVVANMISKYEEHKKGVVREVKNLTVGELNSSHIGQRIRLEHDGTFVKGILKGCFIVGESGGAYYDDNQPDEGDKEAGKVLTIGPWRSTTAIPMDTPVSI